MADVDRDKSTGADAWSRQNDLESAEELTNSAIASLRAYREEQKTLPEIHVHVDSKSEKSSRPLWLTIAVSLGVPAILLELIRRILG